MKRSEYKKQLKDEANARAEQRAKRSDIEQLAKLNANGWTAKNEKVRLNLRIKQSDS